MNSRRSVTIGVVMSLLLGILAGRMWASDDAGQSPAPAATAEAVRARLADGNARFVAGRCEHPNSDAARLADTATNGQHPVVTVVSCSDSRVPVERIFDQGVGDVFVIRVAGNVCGTDELGSVEYGVDHLGTPLLVVLGTKWHRHLDIVFLVEPVAADQPIRLCDELLSYRWVSADDLPPLVSLHRRAIELALQDEPAAG